ncbi:Glu/Leu/Phe/Val dehydrogenase family protein [Aeromicrobium sp.]|uniref:Glu/Leu/Phe/Val dehydrogenase family protein n=1 Tax=Aeromicrobium sp. TaxID=1871063 RepID=UPI002FCB5596
MIEDLVVGWDGVLCSTRYDRETGAFFVIAVHSRQRGPAAGGTRAMQYETYADAVADAMRLASSMTLKMAAADLPMGGGKSVIALPAARHDIDDATWQRILAIHAEDLSILNGSYWTGPDVGTTAEDMDVLHAASGLAFGRSERAGGPGSSAPSTAQGVHVALVRAAAEAGLDDLTGRRVVIQGLGAVGMDVLRLTRKDGAELIASDIDEEKCEQARELGATIVPPDDVLDLESDVFVPCAMGGLIDLDVARRIRTSVIAGAANTILTEPAVGDELARRGIVYAPDFIANSGGAIHLVGREVLGWSAQEVAAHIEGIGATLGEVFEQARATGSSAEHAAHVLAESRL